MFWAVNTHTNIQKLCNAIQGQQLLHNYGTTN